VARLGGLDDRLARLEDRYYSRREADSKPSEWLRLLSDEELAWLLEPAEEAESRVPCENHVGLIECGCSSKERMLQGLEEFTELAEEYERRLSRKLMPTPEHREEEN
jgi:hypothetical protein